MELNPHALDEILEVLREHGATQFSCPAFSVTLGVAPVAESEEKTPIGELVKVRGSSQTFARGLYANPALWPDGTPPTFPKKDS